VKSLPLLVCVVALVAACESRSPVYRAKIKLLITRSGATPADGSADEDIDRFVATQRDVLLGLNVLRRTEQRMNRTAEEVRNKLADVKVTPVRGADIIVVSVDSPSPDFAKEFANTLVSEYLKFRDEQRAQTSENALSPLVHETERLREELKIANEKLTAFEKAHGVSTNSELSELELLAENREQVRSLYNASLAQLTIAQAERTAHGPGVTILEPAIVEPHRVD
jgi:uncharacterized protein involved in exopolysaccharide biosynthesis